MAVPAPRATCFAFESSRAATLDGLLPDPAVYAAMLDETLAADAADRAVFAALGQPTV